MYFKLISVIMGWLKFLRLGFMSNNGALQQFAFLGDIVGSDSIVGFETIDSNFKFLIDKRVSFDPTGNLKVNDLILSELSENLKVISETISIINGSHERVSSRYSGLSDQYVAVLQGYVGGLYEMFKTYISILCSMMANPANNDFYHKICTLLQAYSSKNLIANPKFPAGISLINILGNIQFQMESPDGKPVIGQAFSISTDQGLITKITKIMRNGFNIAGELIELANLGFAKPLNIVSLKINHETSSYDLYGLDVTAVIAANFYQDYGLLFNPSHNCFSISFDSLKIPSDDITDAPVTLFLMTNFFVGMVDYIHLFDSNLILKNNPRSMKDLINTAFDSNDPCLFSSSINPT